jgi:hypothetical protein
MYDRRTPLFAATLLGFSINISATPVEYDFSVQVFGGSLNEETYTGSFAFDDPTADDPMADFDGQVELTAFSFAFVDTAGAAYTYGLDDDPFATADFASGSFLGITYYYSENLVVSFAPGWVDSSTASFFYDLSGGSYLDFGGSNDLIPSLVFTLASANPDPDAALPIPPTWLNLTLGAALMAAGLRHRPSTKRP